MAGKIIAFVALFCVAIASALFDCRIMGKLANHQKEKTVSRNFYKKTDNQRT
jgi:hypothetical protein